jgi:hypothetical protein
MRQVPRTNGASLSGDRKRPGRGRTEVTQAIQTNPASHSPADLGLGVRMAGGDALGKVGIAQLGLHRPSLY